MSDRVTGIGRREFASGLALAGSVGLAVRPGRAAAEPPPDELKKELKA